MRPRRKHERFVRRLETEFIGQDKTYRAISSDFSRYGLFIRTNHAFVPGTELEIVIHLPNGTDCKLRGLVMRAMKTPIVSLKNGMGIQLTCRDENYIRFLKEFDPTETGENISDGSSYAHNTCARPSPGKTSGPTSTHAPSDFVIVACPVCSVKNKVRREKLSQGPKCGKCGALLSPQA